MKIAFISNYYNHHQHPLSQALNRLFPGGYHFIATSEMRSERKALGYGGWDMPGYVRTAHTGEADLAACRKLIDEADALIAGSAPEALFRGRIAAGKLVLRYCERPLKKKITMRHRLHFLKTHLLCRGKSVYLLCAGAYVAGDYARHGCFRNRAYKWGYFPETKRYEDVDALFASKEKNTILWAGRFLDWKHPELALMTAKRLRDAGIDFTLNIIGAGQMQAEMEAFIAENGLQDCVCLKGSMKPEQVRAAMEKSALFLLTSDRQEGWGAVVNEAMNSGCAVVASSGAGSVPYLIRNGENGLIFPSGDGQALFQAVNYLLEHPGEQLRLGRGAYRTITEEWNAEVAAGRLAELTKHILAGERAPDLYSEGPCSRAEIIDEETMIK